MALDEKEEKLLEQTYKIEKENNEMLKSLYHSMWWDRFFRVVYWSLFIGIMFASYYFAQPYIGKMVDTYNTVSGALEKLRP